MDLESSLSAFDLRFVTLKGVIEVVPRSLNKGLVVTRVLKDAAAKNGGDGVDFVLCMGDDVSDEKMFTVSLSQRSRHNKLCIYRFSFSGCHFSQCPSFAFVFPWTIFGTFLS